MKVKNNKERNQIFDVDFSGIIERSDGAENVYWNSTAHYKNRRFHREDGPAVERCRDKFWYLEGTFYGCLMSTKPTDGIRWMDANHEKQSYQLDIQSSMC